MKMLKSLKSNRGIAPFFIFVIIILVMIGIYLLLLIPIPSFTKIRAVVNYFFVIVLWFLFQGLIIYGYYKLTKLAIRGFGYYKKGITKITDKTKNLFEVSR